MEILKKRGLGNSLIHSERKFFLLVLLSLLVMTVLPASAHLEPPVNSRWAYTTPTIDGTLSLGEWTDATVFDFAFEMRSRTDGTLSKTLDARFYVKNNWTTIHVAIEVFNDDYEADDFENKWNGLALLFEEDHDGVLSAGDNGEGVTTWTGSPFYTKNDLYYTGSSWDADVNALGTNDGTLAWSHTNATQGANGNWTFEMLVPLMSTDGDAYDLDITTLPETVGFKIWFQEPAKGTDGVYPDDPTINKNIQEATDATTFGDLILHPLYTLTITATAGGTTNPAPGVYLHGWGEMASVLATPSGGYVFDHWELDTVNVGSTNPYPVTIDMNHTLHAVFRVYVPPVVGGMAAPIVIPINEPSLLAPLIWLASAIMLPLVATVVFVKLKKKKL